jgi:hypothetical protein
VKTIVTGPIVHRCPYVDEVDEGYVELTFNGPAPELHALAKMLTFDESITHEDLTQKLATELGAVVVTWWTTAGLTVEVRSCDS